MSESITQPAINMRQAKSFKAAIVITRNDGIDPSMQDLETILLMHGVAYAMPSQVDGTTVISFNYVAPTPPREGEPTGSREPIGSRVSHGSADILEQAPELAKKKGSTKEDRI
jgi:hypothetical protein